MPPATYLISLGLFGGSLLLAVTSGLALSILFKQGGKSGRWPLLLLAKTVVLWPLTALLWPVTGYWVGHLGYPVLSLMPAMEAAGQGDVASRVASIIWWWGPPVFLLALPLAAQILASVVEAKKPWYLQVREAGFLGVLLLPVIEHALALPGALSGIVPALNAPTASHSLLFALVPWAGLALAWYCLAAAWPRSATSYQAQAEDKIREGALVIGLSPQEVWQRHLRRNQVYRILAKVCSVLALGLTLWVSYGWPGLGEMSREWQQVLEQSISQPMAPVAAAWPYALCALSLWLLGRIILSRQSHR
jgi:hypothetical protein